MRVSCDNCGKTFYNKSTLSRHKKSATCSNDPVIFTCESCLKEFTYKSNLIRHQKTCKAGIVLAGYVEKIDELSRKNKEKREKIKEYKDGNSKLKKEILSKDELIARLKIENEELRDQLLEQQGIVKGMQTAPDKRTIYNTNTAYVHPKLVNLPINNIRALTTEFIEERVNDGILTYEKAAKGYSGMLEVICELITHENDNGEIERNYVCTDVSRNSFHRLLKSKKWKADKGGRYLNDMLDRFIDQMDEYKNKAYDIYDQTPHDSMEWPQVDWERKNISKLFSGVVCKEGTGDREDLVNALRKEIAKRASV